MKTILWLGGVFIVAGIGYYLFMQPAAPADTTSDAKIDINAVCEGALAYMTFENGAAAEAFVQECKNGEHPEVIEKYRADMNLDDGATI